MTKEYLFAIWDTHNLDFVRRSAGGHVYHRIGADIVLKDLNRRHKMSTGSDKDRYQLVWAEVAWTVFP